VVRSPADTKEAAFMVANFNADDILAMAEQIERNGAAFYRRAAEISTDDSVKKRLEQLAEWEGGHESLFSKMRENLKGREAEPTTFDPNGDAAHYLTEMANRHVFRSGDVTRMLTGKETPEQVLDIAIDFERDSILFFQGVETLVPAWLGKDKVHALVEEEMGHVAYLAREKAALKSR